MSSLVTIILLGWAPVVLSLFSVLPSRRAVLIGYLLAWLFLPMAGVGAGGALDYNKMTATSLGVLAGMLLLDTKRLFTFRPGWIDLPMVIWTAAKFASSMSNGLGAYDGASAAAYHLIQWGLPWLFGRLYFNDLASARELAAGLAFGGLVYVPLCLFEVKMSPVLHSLVYGFHQHQWAQAKRYGGWRPTVFMQHGLMVAMWMCMTGLTAFWLWFSGAAKRLAGLPITWCVAAILVTAVLCKSAGPLALLLVGIGVLVIARQLRWRMLLWCVVLASPLYMAVRLSSSVSIMDLLDWKTFADQDRIQSLQTRVNSENQLIAAGWHRPLLGFRGWFAARPYFDPKVTVIPDAYWTIEFTETGLLGLAGLTLALLGPSAMLLRRTPQNRLFSAEFAQVLVLALVPPLFMVDNLFNAMINPLFVMTAGAVGSIAVSVARYGQQPLVVAGDGAPAPRMASRRTLLAVKSQPCHPELGARQIISD